MVSIHDRPAAVTERAEIGHWEGDLVMGKRPSTVATLVERSTRYVRILPLPHGYKADAVRHAIAHDLAQLPASMRLSLTWDRGREMAEHQELASQLGIDVYFCDPRSLCSAAATRTRTGCCASTSARAQTCAPCPSRPRRHRHTDQQPAAPGARLVHRSRVIPATRPSGIRPVSGSAIVRR